MSGVDVNSVSFCGPGLMLAVEVALGVAPLRATDAVSEHRPAGVEDVAPFPVPAVCVHCVFGVLMLPVTVSVPRSVVKVLTLSKARPVSSVVVVTLFAPPGNAPCDDFVNVTLVCRAGAPLTSVIVAVKVADLPDCKLLLFGVRSM